jgi:hypothetical protein
MDDTTTQQSIPPDPALLDDEDAELEDGGGVDPGVTEGLGVGDDVPAADPEALDDDLIDPVDPDAPDDLVDRPA